MSDVAGVPRIRLIKTSKFSALRLPASVKLAPLPLPLPVKLAWPRRVKGSPAGKSSAVIGCHSPRSLVETKNLLDPLGENMPAACIRVAGVFAARLLISKFPDREL